jgi:hypothetical protein
MPFRNTWPSFSTKPPVVPYEMVFPPMTFGAPGGGALSLKPSSKNCAPLRVIEKLSSAK